MKTRHLAYLCAVLTTTICTDVFSFNVTPATVTGSEATAQSGPEYAEFSANIEDGNWSQSDGEDGCTFEQAIFVMDISFSSGNATWSNDSTTGDLNLEMFRNGEWELVDVPNMNVIVCSNNGNPFSQPFRANLHMDSDSGEGIETTNLVLNGKCYVSPPQLTESRSRSKIEATVDCPDNVIIEIVDATPPPISVSIVAGSNASEPGSNGYFTINLDNEAPAEGLTVNYEFDAGQSTATEMLDFQSLGVSILIPSGSNTINIPVVVINDEIAEVPESVSVRLIAGSGYDLGNPVQAEISIADDDMAGIEITPTSVTVDEDGSTDSFKVSLSSMPVAEVRISVYSDNRSEGTVEGSDGQSNPRVLVFNGSNWNTEQTVNVTGVDDEIDDGDIDFSIMLTAASGDSNYGGLSKSVTATNLDNDSASSAAFSESTYAAPEGGVATITINRVGASEGEFTVTFMTDDSADGTTATPDKDYESTEVIHVFENDEESFTVDIPIYTDEENEEDEKVVLKLEFPGSEEPVTAELIIKDFGHSIDPDGDLQDTNEGQIAKTVVKACVAGENTPDFQALCDGLVGAAVGGESVFVALNEIAPEEAAAARAPATDSMTVQNANVGGRMAALRGGAFGFNSQGFSINIAGFNLNGDLMNSFQSGFNTNQASFANSNASGSGDDFIDFGRWGVFLSGRLIFGDKDASDYERGYDFDTLGLTLGVDYRFTDTFVAGLALGYSDNSVDINGNKGKLDADSTSVTFYGSFYPSDNFYMDGSISLGNNDYDQTRKVDYVLDKTSQTVSQSIAADYDGDQTSYTFGSGYDFNQNGWVFGPTFYIEYTKVDIDAYDEELVDMAGVGWAAHIYKQGYKSLIPSIGFQFSKAISRNWGVIIPQAHASWAKELKNDDSIVSGHFLGDLQEQPEVFYMATDALDGSFFKAGVGFSAMFKNNKSAYLTIDGDFGRELMSIYYINAGFRWAF